VFFAIFDFCLMKVQNGFWGEVLDLSESEIV
jgi:hypothetical protein